jgi:hypothetical protein
LFISGHATPDGPEDVVVVDAPLKARPAQYGRPAGLLDLARHAPTKRRNPCARSI